MEEMDSRAIFLNWQIWLHLHAYMYVTQGYIVPLESRVGSLELTKADVDNLFGNVKSIRDFNR